MKCFAGIGLLLVLVTFTPFVSWYATQLSRPWSDYRGDVLIVLGGAQPNTGMMDPGTYWRCFMAVLYYREHPYKRIVVTGREAAPGMRDFLVFNQIPAERISVENSANNTHENARFTAPLLAGTAGRIVLLTSDSHMYRARRCFEKEGVRVAASAVPDIVKRAGDYSARPQLFFDEMRETAAILYYRWRGWI